MATLQPKAQAALLAAYHAPNHTLRSTRGGYAAPADKPYSVRVINWLDHAYLVTLEPALFPKTVTLNARGIAHAEQLLASRTSLEKAS